MKGEGGGRPRDPPPRPLEEPLQAPAAAPEPSPLPQLLPRKFTSRAAAGKQQPGAGHLLIGDSRAALHLLPAPWKSLLLAFQGGSLLQSSRVVDKHQSHGVNQVPGGEKKKISFFFFPFPLLWYCCGWKILKGPQLRCLFAYKYLCFIYRYIYIKYILINIYVKYTYIKNACMSLFPGLNLIPRERGWSLGRGWCFIRSPVAADPESHCPDLPEGERRWSRGSQESRGELSLVPPARRGRRPLGLRTGPAPHPKAANHSRLEKVMLGKIEFHN